MTRRLLSLLVLLMVLASTLLAHDMFLKLENYYLAPQAAVTVPLLNGTFSSSENAIDRVRIASIAMAGPAGRRDFDSSVVSARHDTTFFALETGAPGTYAIGVATRPNVIAMSGAQFHEYLKEEGLGRVISARERGGIAADSATEQYAKHVKAIVQVGDLQSASFRTPLGYAAELVPLDNPYAWKRGGTLRFRALVNGVPAPRQTVVTGGRTPSGARLARRELATGPDGSVTLRPSGPGVWYLSFISIEPVRAAGHNYESRWATITFQLR